MPEPRAQVSRRVADQRFELVHEDREIKILVHGFHRFNRYRSRYDDSDIDQECWLNIWQLCFDLDPVEDPQCFLQAAHHRLTCWFRAKYIRYNKQARRDPGLEVNGDEEHEGASVFDLLPAPLPTFEEVLAADSFANLLEERVIAQNNVELLLVFLAMVYPGDDVAQEMEKYCRERKKATFSRIPDEVIARSLGMTMRQYTWRRNQVRKLAESVGLTKDGIVPVDLDAAASSVKVCDLACLPFAESHSGRSFSSLFS